MIRMILFICSALLFLAGGWIRIQTWGSRLLYVHSVLGRFYRIYLVLWVLALVFFVCAIYIGRKKAAEEREEAPEEEDKTEVISGDTVLKIPEEISAKEEKEITCPNCGTKLNQGAVFCKSCGCRIKEETI